MPRARTGARGAEGFIRLLGMSPTLWARVNAAAGNPGQATTGEAGGHA